MLLSEASKYEASLGAVLNGIATDAQLIEAEAVVFGVQSYLNSVSSRLEAIKDIRDHLTRMANEGLLSSDKVAAAIAAFISVDANAPAVAIDGGAVKETVNG